MGRMPTSLVDVLRWHAEYQPDRLGVRFLNDGEQEAVTLTYAELDQKARSIAASLQAITQPGDRALLLLPTGLDFIAGYMGCLYAGVIAIPLAPPHPARLAKTLTHALRILRDARPTVALVSTPLGTAVQAQSEILKQFRSTQLLVTDNPEKLQDADQWQKPNIEAETLAFLQYTSGSTTLPKGVMVSHGNLLHNLALIEYSFRQTPESRTVIWLPPYHDMGLIGGILQPLFTGNPVTLMPHLLFLQRPLRWLQAISRYQATTSGGPNFAYELCLKKVSPEQRDQLDLSHWNLAFNGAEPIYHKTLDRFADYFAPCGFRKEALSPCYGLAETTLMVTGGPQGRGVLTQTVAAAGLENNQVSFANENTADSRTLVSCGQNLAGQNIQIVDAGTLTACPEGVIGEVWVQGPSVTQGYWKKPVATQETFEAYLADGKTGPFLRTGDLGYLHKGELFITGRLKNLLIINGKNHYPHDIERTVATSHEALRVTGIAVFSISRQNNPNFEPEPEPKLPEGNKIVIMAEVARKWIAEPKPVIEAIRNAVTEIHEVPVQDVHLTLPGSIPRTTSGKIQHYRCRELYLAAKSSEITRL